MFKIPFYVISNASKKFDLHFFVPNLHIYSLDLVFPLSSHFLSGVINPSFVIESYVRSNSFNDT